MDKAAFCAKFLQPHAPAIRTAFNRSRFIHDPNILLQSVSLDPVDFSRLYAPWYVDRYGKTTTFNQLDARPITISEAAGNVGKFQGPDWAHVASCTEKFRAGACKVVVEIPAVALPGNDYVVLDGNHRLTAFASNADGSPVRVELIAVAGLVGEYLVPDLRHWQRL